MQDTVLHALQQREHQLAEDVAGELDADALIVGQQRAQVDAGHEALEDHDKVFLLLEPLVQLDHARHSPQLQQEGHLEWNSASLVPLVLHNLINVQHLHRHLRPEDQTRNID